MAGYCCNRRPRAEALPETFEEDQRAFSETPAAGPWREFITA